MGGGIFLLFVHVTYFSKVSYTSISLTQSYTAGFRCKNEATIDAVNTAIRVSTIN